MNAEMLLLGLAPIVMFVAIEAAYGQRAGILASIGIGALLGVYFYFRFGDIDQTFWVEIGLIVGLGLISLHLKNAKFFKFQPTVTGIIVFAYIIYQQAIGMPILVKYIPIVSKIEPQLAEYFSSERTMTYMAGLSWQIGTLILLHGIACGYSAIRLTSVGWMFTRLAIYPVLFIWLIFGQIFLY